MHPDEFQLKPEVLPVSTREPYFNMRLFVNYGICIYRNEIQIYISVILSVVNALASMVLKVFFLNRSDIFLPRKWQERDWSRQALVCSIILIISQVVKFSLVIVNFFIPFSVDINFFFGWNIFCGVVIFEWIPNYSFVVTLSGRWKWGERSKLSSSGHLGPRYL